MEEERALPDSGCRSQLGLPCTVGSIAMGWIAVLVEFTALLSFFREVKALIEKEWGTKP